MIRYNTKGSDAGTAGDAAAGDAGDAAAASGTFGDPTLWSSFDVSTTNPLATGFAGAFDRTWLYRPEHQRRL